jgi:hypothetical protein
VSGTRRSLLGRIGRVVLGLIVGAAVAEAAFHYRDDGAFPHLNVYEPDPELALRLRPGTSQRLAVARGNPVTSVRVNAQGFRGADLPAPRGGEIVVVGDSQVFGLGVEEDETASAQLAAITGKPVLNAGVPTYGPLEYGAVAKRLLETYEPATIVYVVNFVNDLFEASRPNRERHAEWDGWAVRKETAPEATTDFPGRALLYRDSHAFLALRTFLYEHGDKLDDRGFASEGSARDFVEAARKERERAREATKELAEKRTRDLSTLSAQEVAAEAKLEEAALDALNLRGFELGQVYRQSRDNPGDIVITVARQAEESRAPPTTAKIIYNGAKVRQEVEQMIREHVERQAAREEAEGAKLALSLEERDALKKRIAELRASPLEIVRAWSPMTPHLRTIKAICDAGGVKLLVVALPMDVQVSPEEWAKYDKKPDVDMEATRILVDDLVASSEAIGALALDATPALAAAEPGAFLKGDIHMTPKGQRALAEAIAKKLD